MRLAVALICTAVTILVPITTFAALTLTNPAQTLSAPGADVSEQQVAVDPYGNAVCMWSRGRG